MYIFRENRYIVIEFDEYETTAILGVNNLNVQPHVRVKSVVGYFNEELKEDAKSKELAESYEISKNSVKDNDEPSNEKTERSTNEDEGNIERMECENRNEKEEMVGSKETVLCSEKSDNQPKGEFSAEIGNNLTLEGEQKRVEMGDSENQKPEKNSNLAGAVQSLDTVGKSGDAKDILNGRIESKSTEAHNNTEPKEKIEQLQKSEGTVVADAIKTPEASANVEAGEGSADVSNISTLDTSEAKVDRFENKKVEKSGKDEGNNMAEQENKIEEMMEVDSQVEKMEVDSEPKPEVEQPNENDMVVEQKVYKQKCIVGDDIEKIGLSEPIRAEGIIKEGVICNWEAFRDFCKCILIQRLKISIINNDSPVLLSVPVGWTKYERELLTKMFFEDFNVPAIVIMDRPVMALFGYSAVSGIVIEISKYRTTISSGIDSQIQPNSVQVLEVGGIDIINNLCDLIVTRNPELFSKFGNDRDKLLGFCHYAVENGFCGFNARDYVEDEVENPQDENQIKSNEQNEKEKEEDMSIEVTYNGEKYRLGNERFKCAKFLFSESIKPYTHSRLVDAISYSVVNCELEKRIPLWESISIVGSFSRIIGFNQVLEIQLKKAVLGQSEHFSEYQSRDCKFNSLPDYLYGWRNSNHYCSFLGAMMAAKMTLNDAKYHVTKVDYNEMGPASIHAKQFS